MSRHILVLSVVFSERMYLQHLIRKSLAIFQLGEVLLAVSPDLKGAPGRDIGCDETPVFVA